MSETLPTKIVIKNNINKNLSNNKKKKLPSNEFKNIIKKICFFEIQNIEGILISIILHFWLYLILIDYSGKIGFKRGTIFNDNFEIYDNDSDDDEDENKSFLDIILSIIIKLIAFYIVKAIFSILNYIYPEVILCILYIIYIGIEIKSFKKIDFSKCKSNFFNDNNSSIFVSLTFAEIYKLLAGFFIYYNEYIDSYNKLN